MDGLGYGTGYDVSAGSYIFSILALLFLGYFGLKMSRGEFKFRGESDKMSNEDRARVNAQYKFFITLAIIFTTTMVLLYMIKKGIL